VFPRFGHELVASLYGIWDCECCVLLRMRVILQRADKQHAYAVFTAEHVQLTNEEGGS
jgi:hypothetical protein